MNIKELLAKRAAEQAQSSVVAKQVLPNTVVSDIVTQATTEKPAEKPAAQETVSVEAVLRTSNTEVFGKQGNSLGFYTYHSLGEELQKCQRLAKISPKYKEKAEDLQYAYTLLEERILAYEEQQASLPVEEQAKQVNPNETFSLNITLNERQQAAAEMAMAGKSFVLIGPAGTGKTTCQRAIAKALLEQDKLKEINFSSKKDEARMGLSFAAVAFTRRASANLRRAIHKDEELAKVFEHNVLTIHALLEYEPVYFFDEVTQKETMRFMPRRNAVNKLQITHLVVEEASMVGAYDLWAALYDALPEGVQIIFIGDINQLPPVFGPSILNYALIQLPVIELTEVYRQAGDSGILANAHRILKGETVQPARDVHIIQGRQPQHVSQERTAMALYQMFQRWYNEGVYDPEQDIILSPYNEQALGTRNMNSWIAQFLGEKRKAIVHEVIAGFNKHYLAVGDIVMYDKRDAIIERIIPNMRYMGKAPQAAGEDLSRFGTRTGRGDSQSIEDLEELPGYANFDLDTIMEEQAERKLSASHIVEIRTLDTDTKLTLEAAGDFGPQTFQLGYVLTTHKAQGCEWRHVFILYHPGHRTMIFREWLYTAWTRAREQVFVLGKQWLLDRAVANPRIKGNKLEEKIAYFNSGLGQLQEGVFAWK